MRLENPYAWLIFFVLFCIWICNFLHCTELFCFCICRFIPWCTQSMQISVDLYRKRAKEVPEPIHEVLESLQVVCMLVCAVGLPNWVGN